MSLPVCANSLSLSHLLFFKLMPEHKNHDVKCNQKASLNLVASPSHYKYKVYKCQHLKLKEYRKGKKILFSFCLTLQILALVTKTTSPLETESEGEKTYTQRVTQLHERMPNSATLFSEPRK